MIDNIYIINRKEFENNDVGIPTGSTFGLGAGWRRDALLEARCVLVVCRGGKRGNENGGWLVANTRCVVGGDCNV